MQVQLFDQFFLLSGFVYAAAIGLMTLYIVRQPKSQALQYQRTHPENDLAYRMNDECHVTSGW